MGNAKFLELFYSECIKRIEVLEINDLALTRECESLSEEDLSTLFERVCWMKNLRTLTLILRTVSIASSSRICMENEVYKLIKNLSKLETIYFITISDLKNERIFQNLHEMVKHRKFLNRVYIQLSSSQIQKMDCVTSVRHFKQLT